MKSPEAALSAELLALRTAQECFRAQARAESTTEAYEADWRGFCAWLQDKAPGGDPLAATQKTVAMYLTWMVQTPYVVGKTGRTRQRKTSAMSRAVTGILFKRQELGRPVARHKNDEIAETLAGIRRTLGVAVEKKRPLTSHHLRLIAGKYGESLRDLRDVAIVLLGWYAATRRSEIVALNVSDVEFVASGMILTLTRSKTDQEGHTETKGIKYAKNSKVCAVRSLKRWLEVSGITGDAIFRGFTKKGEIRSSQLTDQIVADIVKDACRRVGLDPDKYAGHSLRAGYMTTGARAGVKLRQLMEQSGHKSERVAVGYIRQAEILDDDNPTDWLVDE